MRLQQFINESKGSIYFGHPGPTYNTQLERDAIQKIEEIFFGYKVLNPNQTRFESQVETRGFDVFFDLIDTCSFSVFMPLPDGRWGVGIYEEAYYTHKSGKKVYELNPKTFEIKEIPNPVTIKYYEIGLTKKGDVKRRIQ